MDEKIILLKDADFVVRDYMRTEKGASVAVQGNRILDVGSGDGREA